MRKLQPPLSARTLRPAWRADQPRGRLRAPPLVHNPCSLRLNQTRLSAQTARTTRAAIVDIFSVHFEIWRYDVQMVRCSSELPLQQGYARASLPRARHCARLPPTRPLSRGSAPLRVAPFAQAKLLPGTAGAPRSTVRCSQCAPLQRRVVLRSPLMGSTRRISPRQRDGAPATGGWAAARAKAAGEEREPKTVWEREHTVTQSNVHVSVVSYVNPHAPL